MKSIMSAVLVFGALVASADDSYLYWMIGDTTPYSIGDYSKVRVAAVGSDRVDYLDLYGPGGDDLNTDRVSASDVNTVKNDGQALYAKLASGSSYSSFFIELLNDSGGFVAQSAEIPYSEALAHYITTANSMSTVSMWAASSFAIPEPNSATLLLVGCAFLGLRRRRQKRA